MNDQTNNRPEDLPQNLDKTIDENIMGQHFGTGTNLTPGSTHVTQVGSNPYQMQQLPSGEETIPLGSGVIAGVLGVGGMAKVYKIWNEKLEVYRAVKILLPTGQKDLAKRFETEVKITAKLHHPNIVDIYNVGEWNGLPYIEMEIIEGTTLDNLIAQFGKLPDQICCAIGVQIAKALSYAHSQEFLLYGKTYNGIIHRDLKPANIMISNQGILKLMDFGIARPTEAGLHTMEGHIVGTLQYLSPEQLDGVAIDNRTDIYSFGAILYEMLTGTKTFPQGTITNLMKMKATNSFRRFNEFNFNILTSLTKCTEKCLQHERIDRFDNADDLLGTLRKIHNGLTDDAPSDSLKKYMQAPHEFELTAGKARLPLKYLIPGGALVALILVAVVAIFFLPKKEEPKVATKTAPKVVTKPVVKQPPQKPEEEEPVKPKPTTPVAKPVKPKPVKPKPLPPVQRAPVAQKPKPKPLSPLEIVKKKYGTNDLLEIGRQACNKGQYSDAVTALQASPSSDPTKGILLLWAYVELKKINSARNLLPAMPANDAFVDLLKGRIEMSRNRDKKALRFFQSSMTKPSAIKNRTAIRNDALYYSALLQDKHFKQSPSSETRLAALTAWNSLKKAYIRTPNHPRFKLANKKMASTN